jgi:ribosomal protein S18 acetylase RimI-like enzyme
MDSVQIDFLDIHNQEDDFASSYKILQDVMGSFAQSENNIYGWRQNFWNMIRENALDVVVARIQWSVVWALSFRSHGEKVTLDLFWVQEKQKGNGIGKEMYRYLENFLRLNGYTGIYLVTHLDSQSFEIFKRWWFVYSFWKRVLVKMTKDISPVPTVPNPK